MLFSSLNSVSTFLDLNDRMIKVRNKRNHPELCLPVEMLLAEFHPKSLHHCNLITDLTSSPHGYKHNLAHTHLDSHTHIHLGVRLLQILLMYFINWNCTNEQLCAHSLCSAAQSAPLKHLKLIFLTLSMQITIKDLFENVGKKTARVTIIQFLF